MKRYIKSETSIDVLKNKPWTAAEDARTKEVSEMINSKLNEGGWCEYYDQDSEDSDVEVIEFSIPGRRDSEITITKSWLTYVHSWDENENRVKRGGKVPGTVYYSVGDDGDIIDENYLGYKTLADARHAAALYMKSIEDTFSKY